MVNSRRRKTMYIALHTKVKVSDQEKMKSIPKRLLAFIDVDGRQTLREAHFYVIGGRG